MNYWSHENASKLNGILQLEGLQYSTIKVFLDCFVQTYSLWHPSVTLTPIFESFLLLLLKQSWNQQLEIGI